MDKSQPETETIETAMLRLEFEILEHELQQANASYATMMIVALIGWGIAIALLAATPA